MSLLQDNIKKHGKPNKVKRLKKHKIYSWGKLKLIVDDVEEIEIFGHVRDIKPISIKKKK